MVLNVLSVPSGVPQDHLGPHRPLLARHGNNSGWNSPREQVRLEESEPGSLPTPGEPFKDVFSVICPVWKSGWASWCTWPATGSVPEASQPPSTITTGQFLLPACTSPLLIHQLTKASAACCRENKPRKGGICVANHTSPIDVVILANDGCYAMVSLMNRWTLCLLSPIFWHFHVPLVGGSDPRGSDGSHPEVHGEGLSSCLVWEIRDEGQTRRDQQVWRRWIVSKVWMKDSGVSLRAVFEVCGTFWLH